MDKTSHLPVCALIIPAAGSGRRMGPQETRKPLLPINGKPVLAWTLHNFTNISAIKQVIIPCQDEDREAIKTLATNLSSTWEVICVGGGKERADSVKSALSALAPSINCILIHDAVRPFTPHSAISKSIEIAHGQGCALVAIPASDTLKSVDHNGQVSKTIDRSNMIYAQTPQAFQRKIIEDCYSRIASVGEFTDDCSLAEQCGYKINIVQGSSQNIKVTTPADLALAKAMIDQLESLSSHGA